MSLLLLSLRIDLVYAYTHRDLESLLFLNLEAMIISPMSYNFYGHVIFSRFTILCMTSFFGVGSKSSQNSAGCPYTGHATDVEVGILYKVHICVKI